MAEEVQNSFMLSVLRVKSKGEMMVVEARESVIRGDIAVLHTQGLVAMTLELRPWAQLGTCLRIVPASAPEFG